MRKPSGGGFSADLAKELTDEAPAGPRTNSAGTDGAKEQAGSGSSAPSAPTPAAAASAPSPAAAASAPTPVAVAKPSAPTPTPAPAPSPAPAAATKLAPELAAIQIDLMPNWVRDVVEPGTVSLAVTQQSTGASQTFVFHYGYESAAAPTEREAYKKWLGDSKTLAVQQDRQAGAAWFLQGTDARGAAAFRVVVNFGGKKLVCYGSLYKDDTSDKLGDIRDEVILQAKKICESIAL